MLPLSISCGKGEFFISKQSICTSTELRELSVGYKDASFFIQLPSGDKKYVQQYDLSEHLKKISSRADLEKILKVGKIHLNTVGKDYKLQLLISGKGGGPVCGSIAYWGTKTVLYSGITYLMGANESIGGAAIGSAMSAVTGSNMVTEEIGRSVIGTPTIFLKKAIEGGFLVAIVVRATEQICKDRQVIPGAMYGFVNGVIGWMQIIAFGGEGSIAPVRKAAFKGALEVRSLERSVIGYVGGGAIIGAIAGRVIRKSLKAIRDFTGGSTIQASQITSNMETVITTCNIAVIEIIGMIISDIFTFCPFCP